MLRTRTRTRTVHRAAPLLLLLALWPTPLLLVGSTSDDSSETTARLINAAETCARAPPPENARRDCTVLSPAAAGSRALVHLARRFKLENVKHGHNFGASDLIERSRSMSGGGPVP